MTADGRKDLPVHPADMIAHEVVTDKENSVPLKVLREYLTVFDVTHEALRAALDDFNAIVKRFRWQKSKQKKSSKKKN